MNTRFYLHKTALQSYIGGRVRDLVKDAAWSAQPWDDSDPKANIHISPEEAEALGQPGEDLLRDAYEVATSKRQAKGLSGDASVRETTDAAMALIMGAVRQVNEAPGHRGHSLIALDEIAGLKSINDGVWAALKDAANVLRARHEVEHGGGTLTPDSRSIARKLGPLAAKLSIDGELGSEGGYDLEAFHVEAGATSMDEASFRKALALENDPDGHNKLYGYFSWDDLVEQWLEYGRDVDDVKRFKSFMESNLEDVCIYVRGSDQENPSVFDCVHPAYIAGIAPDGSVVGVRSRTVWT